MTFYVDSHSIFRFVQNRDSIWRKHTLLTDDIDTQWKQVLNDSNVNVTYALSPQAKGKIERSYAWIQDRIVRSCVRENVSDIKSAQILLDKEIFRYNHKQVHAITQEIPYYRFNNAFLNGKSLFRKFSIKSPFISHKDIFCIRHKRTIDAYRRISFFGLTFSVKGSPYDVIELRTYKINDTISEIRFWYKNNLIDVKKVKNSDIKSVHF